MIPVDARFKRASKWRTSRAAFWLSRKLLCSKCSPKILPETHELLCFEFYRNTKMTKSHRQGAWFYGHAWQIVDWAMRWHVPSHRNWTMVTVHWRQWPEHGNEPNLILGSFFGGVKNICFIYGQLVGVHAFGWRTLFLWNRENGEKWSQSYSSDRLWAQILEIFAETQGAENSKKPASTNGFLGVLFMSIIPAHPQKK